MHRDEINIGQLAGNSVVTLSNGTELRPMVLVGADGANSKVQVLCAPVTRRQVEDCFWRKVLGGTGGKGTGPTGSRLHWSRGNQVMPKLCILMISVPSIDTRSQHLLPPYIAGRLRALRMAFPR